MCYKPTKFILIQSNVEDKKRLINYNSANEEQERTGKIMNLPCGKCATCMIKYSQNWANRCSLEARQHKENHFITLTYNEKHIPKHIKVDKRTGETEWIRKLEKEHLRKFIKDIRNYYYRTYNHKGIKFFACGEYGSKKGRPHYHIILFNLPLPDKKLKRMNSKGEEYYTSEIIDRHWGKGITEATKYSWNTGEYIARYIAKRERNEYNTKWYEYNEIPREFITMSNGIAKKYLEDNMQTILDNDRVMINKKGTIKYTKAFRYYLRLLEEKYGYPERVQEIKDKRERIAKNKELWKRRENRMYLERDNRETDMRKYIHRQERGYERQQN